LDLEFLDLNHNGRPKIMLTSLPKFQSTTLKGDVMRPRTSSSRLSPTYGSPNKDVSHRRKHKPHPPQKTHKTPTESYH
jgi:hypothetical protein